MWKNNIQDIPVQLSVIMPSLNVVSFIRPCIESVLSQTFNQIEILCIDAGSTDGTLEILLEYARKDSRVRIINSARKSYGYQLNIGICEARGEYVGIVETDDYIHATMYESLYSYIHEGRKPDFIKSGYIQFANVRNKRIFLTYNRNQLTGLYGDLINFQNEREKGVLDLNHIWSGIYKRSFLVEKGIKAQETPGASYQDLGFSLLVGLLADTGIYVEEGYYYYRIDNENSSVKSNSKRQCVIHEFRYVIERLTNKGKYSQEIEWLVWKRKPEIYYWNALRLPADEREKFLMDIEQELEKYEEGNGYFDGLNDSQKKNVMLLKSKKALNDYFIKKEDLVRDFKYLITLAKNDEKFVLVGAGRYGKRMLLLGEMLEKKYIEAVADNSEDRQGHIWNQYILVSVKDAVTVYRNSWFLIANKNSAFDILNELIHLGVSRDRILMFCDMLSLSELIALALE